MQLSKDTYQKLVALVDALAEEFPNLDQRIRCAALQIRDGSVSIRMRNLTEEQLERWFWLNVTVNESTRCWEWQGCRDSYGYGRIKVGGKKWLAHRLAYFYFTGIKPVLLGCHRCDNPCCVNPFHIFWGTHLDNTRDMISKGRNPSFPAEMNPNRKLDWEKVHFLRNGEGTLSSKAKILGIGYHYAWKIKAGKNWNHRAEKL